MAANYEGNRKHEVQSAKDEVRFFHFVLLTSYFLSCFRSVEGSGGANFLLASHDLERVSLVRFQPAERD